MIAALSYQITGRNKLVLHRDFGDAEHNAEVIAADISDGNRLTCGSIFTRSS